MYRAEQIDWRKTLHSLLHLMLWCFGFDSLQQLGSPQPICWVLNPAAEEQVKVPQVLV
jgi:hypothetical protein